jgi:hypothetical protein
LARFYGWDNTQIINLYYQDACNYIDKLKKWEKDHPAFICPFVQSGNNKK